MLLVSLFMSIMRSGSTVADEEGCDMPAAIEIAVLCLCLIGELVGVCTEVEAELDGFRCLVGLDR